MEPEIVWKNACQTTGEGPHWDARSNCLLFVDIGDHGDGGIHRFFPDKGMKDSVYFKGSTVSFVIPSTKGGYLIGLNRTISHYDWDTKTLTKLYEAELRGSKNRFNDAKCDPRGRLWAGTMGSEHQSGIPEKEKGILCSMDSDGQVKTWVEKIGISNGLSWTSDHKTMYYIDSAPRKVYAFDYDIETGSIANQRTIIDFSSAPIEDLGFPDGMAIDSEDNIWIACYLGCKVIRFDPNTGERLKTLTFAAPRITSCCFGGKNLDELFVTCANGVSDEEKAKYPLAGSVFKVTGLGVKGTPSVDYKAY